MARQVKAWLGEHRSEEFVVLGRDRTILAASVDEDFALSHEAIAGRTIVSGDGTELYFADVGVWWRWETEDT